MAIAVVMNSFFQQIWNWVNQLDQSLFLKINIVYTNSFLDAVYPWYREGNAWVPLYLFLIIFSIMNFKSKAFSWILFIVITLVLTDQISSSWVKPFFERPRPCRDPFLMSQVRLLLNGCSGGYSFTSSHATNHFGFAFFLVMTLGKIMGRWKYAFLLWAASISYGQVYVGVHYPSDILCGAILGSVIGLLTSSFYLKRVGQIEIYDSP